MIILYVAFAFRAVSVRRGDDEEMVPQQLTRQERRRSRREEATAGASAGVEKRPTVGVSSWHYGIVAVITLFHDIIIPLGVFALLGQFMGVELDILFVMALLAILGYSVNDTIVVFDRVRENLRANAEREVEESFEEVVGHSLEQTYARSINTSLTTLFVLISLLFLAGASTTYFILALTIGVVAGVFSSIAFASPLLILIEKHLAAKKESA
jgi:preprotein translocase subunit SecF